jgi:LysR family transcriptional regulator, nitrogen assimilation regulatory protein
MELRSIQYFLQIADEGSITRTAQKIGVAQPALTRHVQQLEAELGSQLLLRLPRGVRLTTAGRDFLEHARRIVLEVARAKEHVHGSDATPRGRVVFGTSPTLAPLLLPGCIARARQQCPMIALQVTEGFSSQLLDALLTGRLDVAVMTNPPRSRALSLTPLISEPLVVLSPPGERGTARPLSLAELARTPVIVTVGMRTVIDEQLASFGAQLRVEATVDSVEAIRRLVLAGIGTTIMPVSAFHAEIAAGSIAACTIEGANLHRILVLARPVAPTRSAAIDEIERIVRAEMTELLDAGLFRLPILEPVAKAQRDRPAPAGDPRRGKRRRKSATEKR